MIGEREIECRERERVRGSLFDGCVGRKRVFWIVGKGVEEFGGGFD